VIPENTQHSLVSRHESVNRHRDRTVYAMHPAFVEHILVNLPRLVETVASDGVVERYSFERFRKYNCTISYDLWNGTGMPNPTIPWTITASA
jgi:hypothetical protein